MTRFSAALLLAATALVAAPRPAAASTKFHNATSNTIWAAHAFDSVSGFLCGWSDGCSGPESRVQGWFQIAPGATMTVEGHGYGNARHEAYAEDGLGHFWSEGDGYALPNDAFDRCQYDDWLYSQPTSTYYEFFYFRNTTCCGGSCPTNGTLNFNP